MSLGRLMRSSPSGSPMQTEPRPTWASHCLVAWVISQVFLDTSGGMSWTLHLLHCQTLNVLVRLWGPFCRICKELAALPTSPAPVQTSTWAAELWVSKLTLGTASCRCRSPGWVGATRLWSVSHPAGARGREAWIPTSLVCKCPLWNLRCLFPPIPCRLWDQIAFSLWFKI